MQIQSAIEETEKAIRTRRSEKASADESTRRMMDEEICIATRSLYSRYVDAVLWTGNTHLEITEAVRKCLREGLESIEDHSRCRQSVMHRLRDFEEFARGVPPMLQNWSGDT